MLNDNHDNDQMTMVSSYKMAGNKGIQKHHADRCGTMKRRFFAMEWGIFVLCTRIWLAISLIRQFVGVAYRHCHQFYEFLQGGRKTRRWFILFLNKTNAMLS